MADTIEDMRTALEKQIADLHNQVSDLVASAAAQADKASELARDYADEALDDAGAGVAGTARQIRRQAGAVAGAIRENPRTAATLVSSTALLGFALGLLVGTTLASQPQRRNWY